MMTHASTRTTSGCGCGGASAATSSPCPCGGSGSHGCSCHADCGDQGFRRPNFFEGQLLTEDDLQAVTTYVVQKNRLHMRHLFGDGVVCGLWTKINPCDATRIVVEPGYALDCCGNDIVLSCPQELDIRRMVRDLQAHMKGGHDCGDPCADETPCPDPKDAAVVSGAAITTAAVVATPGTTAATKPPLERRRSAQYYCLYVHYCEQGVDPTTPYATGDACGAPACYPTRYKEGFRFELRCRPKPSPHDDLLTRICECVNAYEEDDTIKRAKLGIDRMHTRLGTALRELEQQRFEPDKDALQMAIKAVRENKRGVAWRAVTTPGETPPDDERIDQIVDASESLLKQVARIYRKSPEERKGTFAAELKTLPKVMSDAASLLESEGAKQVLDNRTAVERVYVNEVADRLRRLSTVPAESHQLEAADQPLVAGLVLSDDLIEAGDDVLRHVRKRLLFGMERSGLISPSMQKALSFETVPAPGKVPLAGADRVSLAAAALYDRFDAIKNAAERYLLHCLCDALNPPCLPCDDLGVLLACFTWDDCEVSELCPLERKFVLTGPSARYWLPFIGRIGDVIEEQCCPATDPCGEPDRSSLWVYGSTGIRQSLKPPSMLTKLVHAYFTAIVQFCLRDKKTAFLQGTGGLTGVLGALGIRPSAAFDLSTPGEPRAATIDQDEFARAFEAAMARPEFVDKLRERLGNV